MRFFWTLTAVPRPDASYLALFLVTLTTFLLFQDVPVTLFGSAIEPLQLALAVFYLVAISRNLILSPRIWANSANRIAGLTILCALPFVLAWILSATGGLTVQLAYSAYALAYAAFILGMVNWDHKNLHLIPSVWARDTRFSRPALTLVAIGDAAYAVALVGLALVSSDLVWMLFMTLGAIMTKLFVNWIVVLLIIVRLDEDE